MAHHLTHPDSKQEIEVDADRVPMYQSQGWQTKTEAKPAKPKAGARTKPTTTEPTVTPTPVAEPAK